jgi:hypothetical protein
MKPRQQKLRIIIAHVEGSRSGVTEVKNLDEVAILLCVGHCFNQDRALFIRLSNSCLSPSKLSNSSALGGTNGDDHFTFEALHLHQVQYEARTALVILGFFPVALLGPYVASQGLWPSGPASRAAFLCLASSSASSCTNVW